jgi:peptidoglycan/LPS O-acetylase OafA/YrhL
MDNFKTFDYRKEIDGLRALAVISVILFHAGFDFFSGGFIGVDIFFVISGYLITSLILQEKINNKFSLVNFYERRARRILPALFLVVIVTIPFAFLVMSPLALKEFSNSLISIPLFLSNFQFWSESGYFATAAEEKPLLHTWSLAVEEQYYLFFPLLILFTWKLGLKALTLFIFLISIFSFSLSQFGANLNPSFPFIDKELRINAIPEYSFFFSITRAWELLFGSLTAIYLIHKKEENQIKNQLLSLLGILLISYPIFLYDYTTQFPGFSALMPVAGTVLLVVFSNQGTLVYKFLSHKALVFIGLISYSLYLWHYPIFSFARLTSIGTPSSKTYLFLLLISFLLAFLSWKYFETPFRKKNFFTRKQIFLSSLIVGTFIVSIGVIGASSNGFVERFSAKELKAIQPEKFDNSICNWTRPIKEYANLELCEFGDLNSQKNPIVLYGDSHADSLTNSLDRALKNKKIKGIKVVNSYCEPIVGFYRKVNANISSKNKCEEVFSKLLKEIKKINAEYIIIFNRWTFRFFPVKDQITQLNFNNEEGGIEYVKNYREYFVYDGTNFTSDGESKKNTFDSFINSFLEKEIKVKLIYPLPEVGWNLPKLNMANRIFEGSIPMTVDTSYKLFLQRNEFSNYVLDSLKENLLLEKVHPDEVFCNKLLKDRCFAQIDGIPLYYDSNHLNNRGAEVLIKNTNLVK